MVDIKSGPIELVRGVIEAVFGKGKQFIGTILGRDDLINEGEAQEDKAALQRASDVWEQTPSPLLTS